MVKANKLGEEKIEKILLNHKEFFSKRTKLYLKNDDKKYRVPDFYLHKYNLAIEYFGSWSYPENLAFEKRERIRFLKKVDAYNNNNINCVFIYPNELVAAEEIIFGAIREIIEGSKPLAWVLPWLYEDKIDPPRAEDFIEKNEPLNWVIPWLYEKKIEAPRAEDFLEERVAPLNWNIPWLNEKKIEAPRAEDFLEEEVEIDLTKKKEEIVQIDFSDGPSEPIIEKPVSNEFEKYIPIIGFLLIALIVLLIILFLIAFFFGPK